MRDSHDEVNDDEALIDRYKDVYFILYFSNYLRTNKTYLKTLSYYKSRDFKARISY